MNDRITQQRQMRALEEIVLWISEEKRVLEDRVETLEARSRDLERMLKPESTRPTDMTPAASISLTDWPASLDRASGKDVA